jgi:cell division septation protein DedD
MARDWRKVALAVFAAAAIVSVCAAASHVQAKQPSKSPKSAKSEDGDDKKRQDPAEARRAVEAASKLLDSGKAEQAERAMTATLAGGNLPPAIMAKALYVRGIAYRKQGKPAQAISDLTSALWLKGGLTAEDRADALKQRSGAYTDAGLTERGEIASAARTSEETKDEGRQERKARGARPPAGSWGAVTTSAGDASANTAEAAQGGGNWFKSWFNNWATPGAQANAPAVTASIDKPERPPREAKTPHSSEAKRISSAWSSATEVHAAPAAPARSSRRGDADGKYRVQLGAVRTQREAEALAAKAKRALGELAAGEPEIDRAVLGNMGSFYRVRVGPYATVRETEAVCAKVKGTGLDCLTVTQ